MGYNIKLVLCICSLALILARVSSATSRRDIRGFINEHNKARAEVGVGPIKWNETIARYAQNYANVRSWDCAMEHSMGPYGENIASGEGMTGAAAVNTADLPRVKAVDRWEAEKVDYNYESNSCADGKMCGHYRQVVWNMIVRLGCAKVRCSSGGTFIGCNYDPPGNYQDEKP
ncbi:basic form of pathogenesis-related protein 1-like [Pyrus ussuriensis x Pyrus communis]|uniref:Basic form of pathogenesis-related protein 1-like n=1 Tax=Pyrus ussuriensis x Pyrus communis TaxID=2448454 RepID=A0A5N5I8N0_9ROSA|nr:basic form of pathogenesis-related protein 1-like [Pyrus ussuriensis x Pyrus communis]